MNNLYRKVAVTSVGIALSFTLGVNKEASSATIILTPTTAFGIYEGRDMNGRTNVLLNLNVPEPWSVISELSNFSRQKNFYEFNIANFSSTSNTVISSAIFQVTFRAFRGSTIDIVGYRGNGQPDLSDERYPDVYLSREASGIPFPEDALNFNISPSVTSFVNELVSTGDAFAGFRIQVPTPGMASLSENPRLIITTVDVAEPVPEPTTIFGSAIGLCLGGWLKRKKSSQQNKTTPQA